MELTRLPDPATDTVFRTECLINKRLISKGILQLLVFDAELDLVLDYFQRFIYVNQVRFLVEQSAEVFDLDSQQ